MSTEQNKYQAALQEALLAMRMVLDEVDPTCCWSTYSADSYLPEHIVSVLRAAVVRATAVL